MTKCVLAMLASALLAGAGSVGAQPAPMPTAPIETVYSEGRREIEMVISRAGWHLMGEAPEDYRIVSGETPGMSGKTAHALQACNTGAYGHGAFERTLPAAAYAGKRVRVTGRVKLIGIGKSTFYINLMERGGHTLRQLNTRIAGSAWKTLSLVTDVEPSVAALDIGVTLYDSAGGTVWLDSFTIETVGQNVPEAGVTLLNGYERSLTAPVVSCDGFKDGIKD